MILEALEKWLKDLEELPSIFNYGPFGFVRVSQDRLKELQEQGLDRHQAYMAAIMESCEVAEDDN